MQKNKPDQGPQKMNEPGLCISILKNKPDQGPQKMNEQGLCISILKKQARSGSAKNEWARTLDFNLKKQARSGSAKNEWVRTLYFNLKNEWARTLYFNLKKQFWGLAGFTMQYSTGIYSKKGGSSNWGKKMNFGLQEWRHRMESFLFLWQKKYNKIQDN